MWEAERGLEAHGYEVLGCSKHVSKHEIVYTIQCYLLPRFWGGPSSWLEDDDANDYVEWKERDYFSDE